jgi:hypothetical protein
MGDPAFGLCTYNFDLKPKAKAEDNPSTTSQQSAASKQDMNDDDNMHAADQGEGVGIVTSSEGGSNSSRRSGSGSGSDLGPSSSEPPTESERRSSGSGGGSDHGNSSSDNGAQEPVRENQGSVISGQVRNMKRVVANRRSARESRDRRKSQLGELQHTVDTLEAENSEMAERNMSLRQEMEQILKECGLSQLVSSSLVSNLSLEVLLMSQGLLASAANEYP